MQSHGPSGFYIRVGLINALAMVLGVCLVWVSVSDGWRSLLAVMGLSHELHRTRVSGDLSIVRWLSIIIGGFLVIAPTVVWRYRDTVTNFSRRVPAFVKNASQIPMLIPLLLALVVLLKTVLQLGLYLSGYNAYSADDFGRTLHADRWLQQEDLGWRGWLQLGSPWLPFPNYLFGLALALHNDLYFTPKIVNLVFSGATVIVVYFLGRELFGRTAGILTAAVFAFIPSHLWLGISGMTSDLPSVFMIALFSFFLVRWFETDRSQTLLAAGGCLFAASGMRYENWFFSVVFSLILVLTLIWRWKRGSLTRQLITFGVAGLVTANIFPIVHVAASYVFLGDLLPAMQTFPNGSALRPWQETDSFRESVPKINMLLLALISFPFEVTLSIAGIALFLKLDGRKSARLYLLTVGASFLVFYVVFQGVLPLRGAGYPRVLLPYIVLFLPYVGVAIIRLLKSSDILGIHGVAFASLLLVLVLTFNITRASNYRDTFPRDAIYAGWTVRKLQEMGTIPEDGKILIERNTGKNHGHLGIIALANRPRRFVPLDEALKGNVCNGGFQTEACRISLQEGQFQLGILWSPDRVREFQQSFGGSAWHIGRYYIFRMNASPHSSLQGREGAE
jgi:Dolichyl-phosphate-mannose-protein mannosyltransferase